MLELKPEAFHLADAVAQPVAVCGKPLIADNSGALYWPGQRTLLVADLQLDSVPAAANGAAANDGHAQPPQPTARQALLRLAEVMDRYEPARVIVLGDGVHAGGAAARLAPEDLEVLRIDPSAGQLTVRIDGADRVIGERAAAGLFVLPGQPA